MQISLVSPRFDPIEPGAPSYSEREAVLPILSANSKRLIIRVQPYVPEVRKDVIEALPRYKKAGVYGVIVEGLKALRKMPGMERLKGDFVFKKEILLEDFRAIRDESHRNGLKFYCGENRLRNLGDSLTCCGIDGLEGFLPNTANLNHHIYGEATFSPAQKAPNSGSCFHTIRQDTASSRLFRERSYEELMRAIFRDRASLEMMGVDFD